MKDKAGFYDDVFNENDDILAEKILMSWKLLKYIEFHKKEYKGKYRKAEDLPENERSKVYKYDFLLHSEYFILNILKDFLKNMGLDISAGKDNLLLIISKIESNDDSQIRGHYKTIRNVLAEYVNHLKKQPVYYHTKFFKNEQSIGLVRSFFSKEYDFIEIM